MTAVLALMAGFGGRPSEPGPDHAGASDAVGTDGNGSFHPPVSAQTDRDARLTPSPQALAAGTLVDVGGRSVYLRCVGTGDTSVVFEAGAGASSSSWWRVLPMVGRFTRACAYDRAGRGRSDRPPSTPTAFDVADDLHTALDAAGVKPPYVLVGHSLGGLYARLYASRHRAALAGLVLVDPVPAAADEILAVLPRELRSLIRTEIEAREGLDWDASLRQLREAQPLGDLPLVVIAAGRRPTSASGDLLDRVGPLWRAGQEALAGLSSNGRLVVAHRSGHFVQEDEPELVVETIRRLVEKG